MKQHVVIGTDILSTIEFPFPVVPIVRHHHENWDGTGYPDGLAGDAIPLASRILMVVDCFDALTSDRPYRQRMPAREAFEILRSRRGTMYDARIVDAFIEMQHAIRASEGEQAAGTRGHSADVVSAALSRRKRTYFGSGAAQPVGGARRPL